MILFDFDGTLADTAPDLAAAANKQRTDRGLPPLPYEQLRPMASQGARGLLRVALDMTPEHPEYPAARIKFLSDYEAAMTVHTTLFDGVPALLEQITDAGLRWGIVTNKMTLLAAPLVEYLGLNPQCTVLVCGDTTAHSKPHPEPLLHAARTAGVAPEDCIYVGDDLRDIQAGRAAGMPTVAVSYGYIGDGEPVDEWKADATVASAHQIWPALQSLRANAK
ncbi:phosphoglycolate phosphatase [Pigmentiphaga aceris]|uniref:phosphoglycolate phosphatase n=1 Tax=Pigmentiphaga aceris TaxID=1940612 RepID=A0A5C0AXY0_9BURK|nr:phosphoglycolate phosphatase [Pigmentiphaga aceris]QEI05441.1 phosphoglycolate phosphatase [Pigmentiphaga aceris]